MKVPKLLRALGWNPVATAESRRLRGSGREPLLRQRLIEVLQGRRFDYKGASYALSLPAIDQILRELTSPGLGDGLLAANERLYARLAYGITVTEFMPDGRRHQPTIHVIDWARPEANRFDLVEAFTVVGTDGRSEQTVDWVGFVNGIPMVVIESPDGSDAGDPSAIDRAIERQLQNQQSDGIPQLFVYAQLLLAVDKTGGRYGTTRTPLKFWSRWNHDEEYDDAHVGAVIRKPVEERDRLLVGLLTPSRLLDIVRGFVLFDHKVGKLVARQHQFFGVRALLRRLGPTHADGRRDGGVVWHTTGSGKSFTMVFLTKALLLNAALKDCRVIVITDRIDLEHQLARNFSTGGAFGSTIAAQKESERAKAATGRDLAQRIGRGNERITFALVQKFNTASRTAECRNRSSDLIVLVDESHRSHGGKLHAQMKKTLPRAAYVAFTGTPLLKDEKVAGTFGPIVHAYTMERAIDDRAVAPLLYEERVPSLTLDAEAIDRWFDGLARGMEDTRRAALARSFDLAAAVHGASSRIELIAWDIATHFDECFKKPGSGLKGQVATASKLDAIRYKNALDATGLVSSRVIISPPDIAEGDAARRDAGDVELRDWWSEHVRTRSADQAAYERRALHDFASAGEPDLLVVVDRLLTGFDEPRNAVLYIDKPLKGHTLMQAVARVNRLHDGKRYGLLIDYRGILRELDTAMRDYQDLAHRTQGGFDIDDLKGLYRRVDTVYGELPALHAALWSHFPVATDRRDAEALHLLLRPRFGVDASGREQDLRHTLRVGIAAALQAFGQCLNTALASREFFSDPRFPASLIDIYLHDLESLRGALAGHRGDASESRASARAIDANIGAHEVRESQGVYAVNRLGMAAEEGADWSDAQARSEAALVRTRLRKTLDTEFPDDPYAQKRFSERLADAIAQTEALFDQPLAQFALLRALEQDVAERKVPGIPSELRADPQARIFFGSIMLALGDDAASRLGATERAARMDDALAIAEVVRKATSEHSLNPQDIASAIRKGLLLRLYQALGLDKTNEVIERVLASLRARRPT